MGICSSTEVTSVQKITVLAYQAGHESDVKCKILKIQHRELIICGLIRRAKKLNARFVSLHPMNSKTQLSFAVERAESTLAKIKGIPNVINLFTKNSSSDSNSLCKLDMFLTTRLLILKNAETNLKRHIHDCFKN